MLHFTFDELPKNLALLFKSRAKEFPDAVFQAAKDKNGEFQYYSYASVYDDVLALSHQFKKIGVQKSSNVALISDNRREWFLTDLALLSLGAADVPRGCDSLGNEIRFIISYSDCEFAVFENENQFKKVLENVSEVPLLKTAVIFEEACEDVKNSARESGIQLIQFAEFFERAKTEFDLERQKIQTEIENEMENVEKTDVATMIFTSGTTGTPKGVMLTHENYLAQISVIHNFLPSRTGDMWLSVLPVWHSFERFIQYAAVFLRNGIAYSKPVGPILLADMAVIRPRWMCGVPRLWESLAKGVQKAMNKKGGITLKMFNFFVKTGGMYADARDKVLGHVCRIKKRNRFLDFLAGIIPFVLLWPLHKLGDVLVFKKLRAKFGGNLNVAISGGGALQREIDNFYRAVGLNLLEGYGLTETAPVLSFRHPSQPRPGCVGVVFPSAEIKIVREENGVAVDSNPLPPGEKGLILARSNPEGLFRQIMKGYYKRPDLTEKVIDKDGWFNTGDLGIKTWDNELKITGRAKDTIVLLGGENIEPAVLEAELLTSDFVESAMVVGQDRKYLGALIVPLKESVVGFAKSAGIEFDSYENLLKNTKIVELYEEIVRNSISTARGFRPCEKIFRFALLPGSFEVGKELSAKQEMRRYKIAELYKDEIESLFE